MNDGLRKSLEYINSTHIDNVMRLLDMRKLTRGVIYVVRVVDGEEEALALYHQSDYREWLGCFSAL